MDSLEHAKRFNLSEEEYFELLSLFVDKGLKDLDSLQTYIEQDDTESALALIHSFKGAAASLWLKETYAAASELEVKIQNHKLSGLTDNIYALRGQLQLLITFNRQYEKI